MMINYLWFAFWAWMIFEVVILLRRKVKNQPPDLTAGEFNRGE